MFDIGDAGAWCTPLVYVAIAEQFAVSHALNTVFQPPPSCPCDVLLEELSKNLRIAHAFSKGDDGRRCKFASLSPRLFPQKSTEIEKEIRFQFLHTVALPPARAVQAAERLMGGEKP